MFRFKKVQSTDLELILKWRTCDRVSRWMLTTVEFDIEKQKKWFSTIDTSKFWVIYAHDQPVGTLNYYELSGVPFVKWGFYIGEQNYVGIGGLIMPMFYNHIFRDKGYKIIFADVMHGNPVIKLHEFYGYSFISARSAKRGNEQILVHEFGLRADTWLENKRFEKCIGEFE